MKAVRELPAELAERLELPEDLNTAIDEMLKDELVTATLGEHITAAFAEAKRKEWREYNEEVSNWEVQRYLNRY